MEWAHNSTSVSIIHWLPVKFHTNFQVPSLTYFCGLALAGNKGPGGHSVAPPPRWSEEENGKKKAKFLGQNKDSLTV